MDILVVEDEKKIAHALKKGLEAESHSVTLAMTGEDAFFRLSTQEFDLLLLDIMLPGRNGIEVLKAFRQKNLSVPVIILTSKDSIEDRVAGLDAGADDYLVKPFAFPELIARIRARTRRAGVPQGMQEILKFADLEVNIQTHSASRSGQKLLLTPREFGLLVYLMRHPGNVVSREMLATDVWNESSRYTPLDNVIDVHIAHLRQKIDEPFRAKLLHTVRGVGFVLREETR